MTPEEIRQNMDICHGIVEEAIQKEREAWKLALATISAQIEVELREGLKFRQTGQDPKTNGYAYAEVPDWKLRQWLEMLQKTIHSGSETIPK